ncbi:MAG: hypothetical protein JO313_03040 [Verrucomicrobia bacterium]|nr:hypothetical protein [Verrucomicrobiota bacterium]
MPKRIFISHDFGGTPEAVRLMEILKTAGGSEFRFFLASDSNSLISGEVWLQRILEELWISDELIVLITSRETFARPWVNFQIGVFVGRKRHPKIFVFGAILPWKEIPRPIADFQLTDTGKTDRWINDLKDIGIVLDEQTQKELAALFRQEPGVFMADSPFSPGGP